MQRRQEDQQHAEGNVVSRDWGSTADEGVRASPVAGDHQLESPPVTPDVSLPVQANGLPGIARQMVSPDCFHTGSTVASSLDEVDSAESSSRHEDHLGEKYAHFYGGAGEQRSAAYGAAAYGGSSGEGVMDHPGELRGRTTSSGAALYHSGRTRNSSYDGRGAANSGSGGMMNPGYNNIYDGPMSPDEDRLHGVSDVDPNAICSPASDAGGHLLLERQVSSTSVKSKKRTRELNFDDLERKVKKHKSAASASDHHAPLHVAEDKGMKAAKMKKEKKKKGKKDGASQGAGGGSLISHDSTGSSFGRALSTPSLSTGAWDHGTPPMLSSPPIIMQEQTRRTSMNEDETSPKEKEFLEKRVKFAESVNTNPYGGGTSVPGPVMIIPPKSPSVLTSVNAVLTSVNAMPLGVLEQPTPGTPSGLRSGGASSKPKKQAVFSSTTDTSAFYPTQQKTREEDLAFHISRIFVFSSRIQRSIRTTTARFRDLLVA